MRVFFVSLCFCQLFCVYFFGKTSQFAFPDYLDINTIFVQRTERHFLRTIPPLIFILTWWLESVYDFRYLQRVVRLIPRRSAAAL